MQILLSVRFSFNLVKLFGYSSLFTKLGNNWINKIRLDAEEFE